MKVLGGAREVGRSAILVKTAGGAKILLDYGVRIDDKVVMPGHVSPRDLDAVLISHAHLDHVGAAPLLTISSTPKIYATESTITQAEILLKDMLKLSGYYLPFAAAEVTKFVRTAQRIRYGERFRIKDAEIEFVDAGHIPGSAQIIVNADKTLIYTGDFTPIKTRLLNGSKDPGSGFDVVVTESTYALEAHEPRKVLEDKVVELARETVNQGGILVVPSFAVARSQEVACILHAHGFKAPVWIDGMARQLLEVYLQDEEYVDGIDLLAKASRRIRIVRGKRDRVGILDEPGVVVSPAGMLKGGPAAYYASKVADDPASSILLVSFQAPNTPGARLLSEGKLTLDGSEFKAAAKVVQYKLSAHAGQTELREYISKRGDSGVAITIHGDPAACDAFASWIKENTGYRAINPAGSEPIVV
ncbi:MAG: MBL fold metallo-hydrolase [Aigarchaeota archaeon]|nr:MBL fold metallo-hydrolase [Candidatus Calditenuaceae archaeon]